MIFQLGGPLASDQLYNKVEMRNAVNIFSLRLLIVHFEGSIAKVVLPSTSQLINLIPKLRNIFW